MEINVSIVDNWDSVERLVPGIEASYREAFGKTEEEAAHFIGEQLPRHAAREGFRLAYVGTADELRGFVYGYTGRRGQWWSDWVAGSAPTEVAEEWIGEHFEFTELAVRPAFQRLGIATALHDRVLAGLPHRRALLTTKRGDSPAARLYLRRGWQVLVPEVDETMALYGRRLPIQPAAPRSSPAAGVRFRDG